MENQIVTQRGFGTGHHVLRMLLAVHGEHLPTTVGLGEALWAPNSWLWPGQIGSDGCEIPFSGHTECYFDQELLRFVLVCSSMFCSGAVTHF